MSLYIKICGLTTADMVLAAVEAGANAVGFVFAPSPREVGMEQAVLLAGLVRGHADIVAVMHHPSPALAMQVQAHVQPDFVQTDHEDFATFALLPGIHALPVHRERIVVAGAAGNRILFEGAVSGSGEHADWDAARIAAQEHSLILAGGLSQDNVAAAVRAVRPFGVDVSSGVEVSRGVKDAARIATFIERAQAAYDALEDRGT